MGQMTAVWDMAWLQADYAAYMRQVDELSAEDRAQVQLMTFHEWIRAQPVGYLEYHGVFLL